MAYDHTKAAAEMAAAHQEKREAREQSDRALQEFLDRGGVIQTVANNVSGRVEGSSYSAWGKPKKKAAAAELDTTEVVEIVDLDELAAVEDDDPEELA